MRDAQAFNVLLFHHNLMIILVLENVLNFFISASVIGIIFMVKFPGNESFRIETASPFPIC